MYKRQWALTASKLIPSEGPEKGLAKSFVAICDYLFNDPTPTDAIAKIAIKFAHSQEGITKLAEKYLSGFRKTD